MIQSPKFAAGAPPGVRRVNVIQGDRAVSANPNLVMTTVLGSCVAACIYDVARGIGGMNHFLLSEAANGARIEDEATRYGAYAMEVLINDLMKLGASRSSLECKLFGGAKMFDSLNDVGAANAAFARRFMEDEGIPVAAASLGGRNARRVEFWPASGRARQREVDQAVETAAPPPPARTPALAVDGGVELF
ncbi:MAG: chemotaxis protein CheD [Caulobacteraceae bacterium]|nr:chemotaxis protein CheD [Caulobacteraceae bacterium]